MNRSSRSRFLGLRCATLAVLASCSDREVTKPVGVLDPAGDASAAPFDTSVVAIEASTPVDAELPDAVAVDGDAAPAPEAGGSPGFDASQVVEAGEAGFDGGPNCRRDATAVVALQGSCCDTQDDCQVPGTGLLSCCFDHVCRYCGGK